MAELKTRPTNQSVAQFIRALPDERRRQECQTLLELMHKATGAEPKMWGSSIIGFGDYHYVYASGREADWFPIGFSPRKQNLTLYAMGGWEPQAALLEKLITGWNPIHRSAHYGHWAPGPTSATDWPDIAATFASWNTRRKLPAQT